VDKSLCSSFTFFSSSLGRITGILNRSAGLAKSAMF